MPHARVPSTPRRRSAIAAIAALALAPLGAGIAWARGGTTAAHQTTVAGAGGARATAADPGAGTGGAEPGTADAAAFGGALASASGGAQAGGSAGATGNEADAAAAAALPAEVAAAAIARTPGTLRPGTTVRQRALGARAFADARDGFALASSRGGQYPVATRDGGRSWRVAGPMLHANAAQAPLVVEQVGMAGPRAYFAWGGPGGGQAVDVTSDGGRHWWRAILGEVVLAVVTAPGHRLVAVTQAAGAGGSGVTAVYASGDGGEHWLRDTRLGAS